MTKSVFIIAEAGSNWHKRSGAHLPQGELETAYTMIDAAAAAGVDAVKFQVFRGHLTYAESAGSCTHLKQKGLHADIRQIFRELEVSDEMVGLFAGRCREMGVEFMASAFSERDFRVIDPHVTRHKIASPELHDPTLLRLAGASGKPVLLSTGISTIDEIGWALEVLEAAGAQDITLLHCTVQYPTSPVAVNLRQLPFLQGRFGRPVGLSDHSRDPVIAPTAAVALGAVVVEKHFTLDNTAHGPDHSWAIGFEELPQMCRAIRMCERMLGESVTGVCLQEEPLRAFSRRSIQATKAITKGTPLRLGDNVAILRPGNNRQGVHPRHLDALEGQLATRDIEPGSGIQTGDWDESHTARL